MPKLILVVDIETTGFLNQGGKIIEIGIVTLDLDTGSIVPVYNSFIKESGFDFSHTTEPFGWIFKNSTITYEDIETAPSLESQRQIIQGLFNKYPATAYNKQFDFEFLKDRKFEIHELQCPMIICSSILSLPSKTGNIKPKWPKVSEALMYFFNLNEFVELHRGLSDAINEAKIVFELYKMGHFVYPSFSNAINETETDQQLTPEILNELLNATPNAQTDANNEVKLLLKLIKDHKNYFIYHIKKVKKATQKCHDENRDFIGVGNSILSYIKEEHKNKFFNRAMYDEILDFYGKEYWEVEGKTSINEYYDFIDWDYLCFNDHFPWDEGFIGQFEKYINFENFSNITNFKWTDKFIAKFEDKLNFYDLSCNESLPWSFELFVKYEKNWRYVTENYDWDCFAKGLDLNRKLPWRQISLERFMILKDPYKWTKRLDYYLYINPSLPWTNELIEKYPPEFKHDFTNKLVCIAGKFWTKKLIEKYADCINWYYLSSNPNIPWSEELLYQFNNNWIWYTNEFDWHLNHCIEEENIKGYGLMFNEKLPWSLSIICKFENNIKWESFTKNEVVWNSVFKPLLDKYKIEII